MNASPMIRSLFAIGVVILSLLAGYLFRTIAHALLDRLFKKTETQIDDILFESLTSYIPLWFFLGGLSIGIRISPLHSHWDVFIDRTAAAIFVITVSLALAKLLSRSMQTYAPRLGIHAPSTSLMENLLRILILILGGMLFLSNIGVSITPLLTALGVGSLAVALALQDTLSNLFAGFYMLINQQIQVGDWIKLDSGTEGMVTDIGLRSTGVRDLTNNIVLIPNAKLAQAIVTNYSLTHPELALPVQMGVAYGSDLDKVERVALEVAKEVTQTVIGSVKAFDPVVRFHTLADSSVNFVVVLRVEQFTDQGLVKHEFVKRVYARFAQEHIEIPFPQRVVHLKKDL
jgi:small-conductance mechanosensitive channel